MGMCGPEDPLFTPLLQFARVPFQAKVSVHKAPLRKFGNFSLYSLNFRPNLSSQAPKFGNFQLTSPQIGKFSVHKPQIWKFSAHKPPFQRQVLVRKPRTSEIRAAVTSAWKKKKSWVPPGVLWRVFFNFLEPI